MNVEKFLEIEKKYGLYDKSIEGVQYWVYARFLIWSQKICPQQLGMDRSYKKKKKSIMRRINTVYNLCLHSLSKRKIPKKNVDILFLNHPRRVLNQSYYECPYTEKLSEKYSNSVTLERLYQNRHYKPVRTHNLMYSDYVWLRGEIYYCVNKYLKFIRYRKLCHQIEKQMCAAIEEIKDAYTWKVDNYEIYEFLAREILLCKKEYKIYEHLLNKINPKIIIEVVYYCRQNMIINELAKKKGIISIELQHGAMPLEHISYQYAHGVEISQFADRLFLFSDFWRQDIHVPISSNNLKATGYPFFEDNVNKYKEIAKKTGINKTILFISQWTIGEQLAQLAVELAQSLDEKKYNIIYKLHPQEYPIWKEKYPYLLSSRIEVIDHNKENIYKYFSISDFQIGVYSTALYEGLGFGLSTLIYRIGHSDSMKKLVSEGYAQYVDNASDAIDYIQSYQKVKVKKNDFWKKNALQNMETEIEKLIYEENERKNITKQ